MEPYTDLTIAQQASKCLTLFELLLESYGEQELSKHDVLKESIRDAQVRFRTWIEGIGALQRREASPDHLLRDPEIRLAVLELLKQLSIDLHHCQ